VLLDEPTAGVDPQTRRGLLAAPRQRAADCAAIVYTTRYRPELADLQATLAVARGGRVIARGNARQRLSGLPGQITVDLGDKVIQMPPPTPPPLWPSCWPRSASRCAACRSPSRRSTTCTRRSPVLHDASSLRASAPGGRVDPA
jgi:ABC-2 type transport system ATP-binding protein